MTLRTLLLFPLLLASALGWSMHLRVFGRVSDPVTGQVVPNALVRVYKYGVVQHAFRTAPNGSYAVVLDNNADYVLRFSLPGHVTKCFAVSTHGPAWQNDKRIVDVEVDMLLFPRTAGLELGLFDLPMGIARFQPMTGLVQWNGDYDQRVRPEAERLMAEVLRRHEAHATAMRGTGVGY